MMMWILIVIFLDAQGHVLATEQIQMQNRDACLAAVEAINSARHDRSAMCIDRLTGAVW